VYTYEPFSHFESRVSVRLRVSRLVHREVAGCCGDHGESGSGGAEDARRSSPGRECAGKAWQHNVAGPVAHQPQ